MSLRRDENVSSSTIKTAGSKMVRLTVNLPSHLVEQMRDAVYWTPGLTLAWMIARAVRASLTELEIVHQGPFPRRPRLVGQSMNVRPLAAGEAIDGANSSGAARNELLR
jgi:hypothetical protein